MYNGSIEIAYQIDYYMIMVYFALVSLYIKQSSQILIYAITNHTPPFLRTFPSNTNV